MTDSQFSVLEQKIDELIRLCSELNRENISLKAQARTLAAEREALLARNEHAKGKVTEILTRLKSMEQAK
jgi:cell division protein ZapB